MKNILFFALLFSFQTQAQIQEINPIVGNFSWVSLYGEQSNSSSSEKERISNHLKFVVEKLEQNSATSSELQEKRESNIRLLREYVQAQNFPRSIEYHQNRRPCFIDNSGNVCAVGYLLEKTAGREETERINSLFQYEYLLDMQDEALLKWQKSSGLSLKELAMIQPTYRMWPRRRFVFYDEKKKKFGTKSADGSKILLKAKYDGIIAGCFPNPPLNSDGTEMVKLKGKWAILKSQGDKITKFVYDTIVGSNSLIVVQNMFGEKDPNPSNLYLFAYQSNKVDVFEAGGKFLFSLNNVEITSYSQNYFKVKKANLFGLVDFNGKYIVPAEYSEISIYSKTDGQCYYRSENQNNQLNAIVAIRLKKDGKYGLMNVNAKPIFQIKFDGMERVGEGLWRLQKGAEYFLYSSNGKKVFDSAIGEIKPIGDCKAQNLKITVNSKFGILDSSHHWLIKPEYDYLERNWIHYEIRKNGLTGLLDKDGKVLLELEYDYIHRRTDGTFFVSKNNLKGKLNTLCQIIIPVKYKKLVKLHDDPIQAGRYYFYAAEEWGKWKILADNGNQIGNQIFDSILHAGRRGLRVKLDNYWYFGKVQEGRLSFHKNIKVEEFTWVNQGFYAYKLNGKYGLWELYLLEKGQGKLFEPKFDEIYPLTFKDSQRFIVRNEGKYGLINRDGEIVIPIEYEEFQEIKIGYNPIGSVGFSKGDQWFYYQLDGDKIGPASSRILSIIKGLKSKK